MGVLVLLLGIPLGGGILVGIGVVGYKLLQLLFGEYRPFSFNEMQQVVKTKPVILIGTISGSLLGLTPWLFFGWSYTSAFSEGVGPAGITLFFVLIALGLALLGGGVGGIMGSVYAIIAFTLYYSVFVPSSRLIVTILGFKLVVCRSCFQYTHPVKSSYAQRTRYCEHCHHVVEQTSDPGKVLVTFGAISPHTTGRSMVIENPDFAQQTSDAKPSGIFFPTSPNQGCFQRHIDVAEVYLDTMTLDPYLLEKFVTHIINDPPRHGLHAVRVFYQGELEHLHQHLHHALRNTFRHVEPYRFAHGEVR